MFSKNHYAAQGEAFAAASQIIPNKTSKKWEYDEAVKEVYERVYAESIKRLDAEEEPVND